MRRHVVNAWRCHVGADLESILIIGSGPIVIGQACEFDYSGTQACKAIREEGLRVVLINSNPATIMTDPELADATYVEPLTVDVLDKILAREKVSAVLPTLGGQTGLNLAMAASKAGVVRKTRRRAARRDGQDDRDGRGPRAVQAGDGARSACCPKSRLVRSVEEARAIVDEIGFPAILRPSFTLGGSGGGIAYNRPDFDRMVAVRARSVAGALDPRRGDRCSAGKNSSSRSCATRTTTR